MNALAMQLYEGGIGGDVGLDGHSGAGRGGGAVLKIPYGVNNLYRRRGVIPQIMPQDGGESDGTGYSHPLQNVFEGLCKLIGNRLVYHASKAVKLPENDNLINIFLKGVKSSFEKTTDQTYYSEAKKYFPFFAQRYGFWKGFSKVDRIYTMVLDKDGKKIEKPLFVLKKGEKEPSSFEDVQKQRGVSPANPELFARYYNDICSLTGSLERYTNSSLKDIEDLIPFKRDLAEIDMNNIQSFGKITDTPVQRSENGQTFIIRKYEKPHGLTTYLPNEAFNWVYDFMDILFYGPVQALFGSEFAKQAVAEAESTAHINLRRSASSSLSGREPVKWESAA
jgi:hypothetical protein